MDKQITLDDCVRSTIVPRQEGIYFLHKETVEMLWQQEKEYRRICGDFPEQRAAAVCAGVFLTDTHARNAVRDILLGEKEFAGFVEVSSTFIYFLQRYDYRRRMVERAKSQGKDEQERKWRKGMVDMAKALHQCKPEKWDTTRLKLS